MKTIASYLLLAVLGISVIACGPNEKERAEKARQDSVARFDSLIKPRKQIYEAALGELKTLLKVPSTAKFPAIALINDTVKIKTTATKAFVAFPYDAQNPMGTYMHDIAMIRLIKKDGKWVAADKYFAVNGNGLSSDYSDFDKHAEFELQMITDNSNGATPAPPPSH